MDLSFDTKEASILLSISPRESDDVAIAMQLVFEEEKRKGTNVPKLDDAFFLSVATSRKKIRIKFDYEYQKFTLAFLEEFSLRGAESGYDTRDLEDFLDLMNEQFPEGHLVH